MIDVSLLQDFIAETLEHLEEMEDNLLQLENQPDSREILNDIFRAAHTVKGSAEYLGMEKIGELSHKLENLLEIIRHGDYRADKEIIDILIDSKDRIALLIEDLERTQTEATDIDELVRRIDQLAQKASGQPPEPISQAAQSPNVCQDPEKTDQARLQKYYSDLKVLLYEMARGDIRDKKKNRVLEILGEFIEISSCIGSADFTKNLEKLKSQAMMLAFPDDAGDMLADLHRYMNSVIPQSYTPPRSEKASETAEKDFLEQDDPFSTLADEPDASESEAAPHVETENDFQKEKQKDTLLSEENEIYEEEYDNELFEIFIQHLKENLSLLITEAAVLRHAENKHEILGKCLEHINKLMSSANYMDYKALTRLYETWIEEIKKAEESFSRKEKILFSTPEGTVSDIKAGMEAYISDIAGRFPQYHLDAALKPETEPLKPQPPSDKSEAEEELLNIDVSDIDLEAEDLPSVSGADEESASEIETEPQAASADFSEEDASESEKEPEVASLGILDGEDGQEEDSELSFTFDEDTDDSSESGQKPEKKETASVKSPAAAESAVPDEDTYQGLFDELEDAFEAGSESSEPESSEPEPEMYSGDLEEKLLTAEISPSEKTEPESPKIPSRETRRKQEAVKKPALPESEKSQPLTPPEPAISEPDTHSEDAPVYDAAFSRSDEAEGDIQKSDVSAFHPEKAGKQTLRVDARKIDALMNQVGELVVSRAWFSQLYSEMRGLQQTIQNIPGVDQKIIKGVKAVTFRISEATVALGRVANDLQEGVMKVRMLPIAQLFNRYPRLVRDLIHNIPKKVRLEIVGEETELDKMVIEEISDPLIHIIRNAVDHGCETLEERRKAGKPEECLIKLESYHESNHVVIEISDDGRGINPVIIKRKALEKNFFSQEELDRMSNRELTAIIMKPGFSTASEVSKTSGRGVGMDVVKKNVEKLNGTLEVDSKVGKGTRFRIKIPLTLAIIRALLVRVGADIFTVPLAAVEETLRVFEHEITMIEGIEVIHLRDATLSLLRLSEIFSIKSTSPDPYKSFVVVVNTGMHRVGLVVDALIGQEETVIKPLVDYLQEKSGFSGATILGDGRISLILDIYELVNMSIGRRLKRKEYMPAHEGTETAVPLNVTVH
jgi:two-component system chemotaxis sensor kinase CheA